MSSQPASAPEKSLEKPADLRERRKWKYLFRYANGEAEKEKEEEEDARTAPVTGRTLKVFWNFVRPHRRLVYLLLACTLINQAMTVVMPVVIGTVLDKVLPRMDAALLNAVAIGLVVFVLLRAFYLYMERQLQATLGWLIVKDVRGRMHAHLQGMSLRFLENYQIGRIVSRIMSDTEALRNLLFGGFIGTASNLLRLVFVAGTLLWIDWRLALVSTFTMPLFMWGFAHHIKRLRPAHKELSEDHSRLWAKASETFSGARVVKTYGTERREDRGFLTRVHQVLRKSLLVRETHHNLAIIWEISAWLGLVGLIWYGGTRVMSGALTSGELVAFYGLLGLLHGPIAELINVTDTVQAAMASIERIAEIMSHPPEIADKPDAREPHVLKGAVRFEGVSFNYKEKPTKKKSEDKNAEDEDAKPKRAYTLDQVDFTVEPGQCIALVGPSGSGKTTLINLLARFYDVDSGRLLVDGVDVRDYRVAAYRRNLAIVLQDNFLFKGTIRENIAYSRPSATEAEIVRAAEMAGAWEFIEKQDKGLDTLCGERGVKLSGGQKQRLSIARAILADPRILILDEATSALDSKAEAQIQRALEQLMRGRTTFVIAHRLSTVIGADKIVVLDEGKIVEMGTHEELLLREGKYFDLFMEQYGKFHFSGRTAQAIARWRERQEALRADKPAPISPARTPSSDPERVTTLIDRPSPLFGPMGFEQSNSEAQRMPVTLTPAEGTRVEGSGVPRERSEGSKPQGSPGAPRDKDDIWTATKSGRWISFKQKQSDAQKRG